MSDLPIVSPPHEIASWSEQPSDCSCWYDRHGRLLVWMWRCDAHPGADR